MVKKENWKLVVLGSDEDLGKIHNVIRSSEILK